LSQTATQRVESYLAKSREAAQEMEVLLKAGHFSGACDRVYYAVFHMTQALMAREGKEFSSHEAVISAFGREFAKTKRIDPKYHRILREAFDLRLTADYDIESTVSEEAAQNLIGDCRDFLKGIGAMVSV
jgi:uncharacterized protein (UPF0332 family)